jgi:hypothetical protein
VVDLIVRVREELTDAGVDAGPETIPWHLQHHNRHRVARSTISRHLTAAGLVIPEPKKRPKSSYIRFETSMKTTMSRDTLSTVSRDIAIGRADRI